MVARISEKRISVMGAQGDNTSVLVRVTTYNALPHSFYAYTAIGTLYIGSPHLGITGRLVEPSIRGYDLWKIAYLWSPVRIRMENGGIIGNWNSEEWWQEIRY
jgi:hypothetical protein